MTSSAADPAPDAWLGGRLTLRQPPRGAGHRAGTDALLLAAALTPPPDALVVDVGAATGAVGLALAARCASCRIRMLERASELVALGRTNIAENGLADRAEMVEGDLLGRAASLRAAGLANGTADVVLTNPPFLDASRHRVSPIARRAEAHALPDGGIAAWIGACVRLLRTGGRLALIHRADALDACLAALSPRIGEITILPVHPRPGAPAIRVLITGTSARRRPLVVLPGLILHEADGRFTSWAEALHRGEAGLDVDRAGSRRPKEEVDAPRPFP